MKFMKMIASASLLMVICGCSESGPAQKEKRQVVKEEDSVPVFSISHRGASAYAPEHTFASYELAENIKADYLEIDLQMTKDGHLIAMHDTTVDRTTDGTGRVKDMTLDQIKDLDAGSWYNEDHADGARAVYKGLTVPTLEEIFQRYGNTANYYIETKSPDLYPGMEDELLRLIDNYGLEDEMSEVPKVIIQSFSEQSLLNIHKRNKKIPLIQLLRYKEPATISDAQLDEIKQYATGIGMDYTKIDKPYVQKVRKAGLSVHPYTVNNREDMKQLIEWGADGMFTNQPDQLKVVKDELKEKKQH